MCVQRFDDSQFCNSHYVSHFAAFFIVVRAKISIAESYDFITKFIVWQFLAHSQVWLERGGFGWFVGCYIGLEYRSHRFVGCWIVDRVEMILPQVHLRNGECFNCGWGILLYNIQGRPLVCKRDSFLTALRGGIYFLLFLTCGTAFAGVGLNIKQMALVEKVIHPIPYSL